MPKAVAVPYIIAIVLGIIVLAVVIYLIYTVVRGAPLGCEECRAMFMNWCASCKVNNWSGASMSTQLSECTKTCGFSTQTDCTGAKNDCQLVGIPL